LQAWQTPPRRSDIHFTADENRFLTVRESMATIAKTSRTSTKGFARVEMTDALRCSTVFGRCKALRDGKKGPCPRGFGEEYGTRRQATTIGA
jgi:hypothetical protein